MDCFGAYFTHLLPTPRPSGMCTLGRCDAILTSIRRPHKVDGRLDWTCATQTLVRHLATWSMLLNVQCKFKISTCAKEMQKVVKAQMLAMPKHVIKFVQSGTQWCASVIRLPKCVVTIVFKRLRHGVVRSILYIYPNHATPCCNLFLIHAFILCHSWFVFDVHLFKWKILNRTNQVQKLLKSEMFEMLFFCCKLHRNLMIHENVMLQLHWKTHTKWVFFKKPTRFYMFALFC